MALAIDADMLVNRKFRFGRVDGSIIASVVLEPDGKLAGLNNPNERSWAVQDGALVFLNDKGMPTTVFNEGGTEESPYVLVGEFTPRGPGAYHVLTEVIEEADQPAASSASPDLISYIDVKKYNCLSVRNWPVLDRQFTTRDVDGISARLRECIAACESDQLPLHELGAIRLLSRVTRGKIDDEERRKYLAEKFSAIPLNRDYTLCFGHEGRGSVYLEYDWRGTPENSIDEATFCLKSKSGQIALFASASIAGMDGIIGSTDTPVIPKVLGDERASLGAALAEALPLLQIMFGAKDILIGEIDKESLPLYRNMVRKRANFSAEPRTCPYVDLTKSAEAIRGDIRKSSRSLVNWGARTLTVRDFSGVEVTDPLAEDVYQFIEKYHANQVAQQGANYMPRWNFDYSIALCRSDRGEISLAMNSADEIVGAAIVIYEDRDAVYYKEGAYNHDVEGKSPAQFLVLHCILRAQSKGFKIFKPNRFLRPPVSYFEGRRSEWEPWRWGNSDFKDGFSSTIMSELIYRFEGCDRIGFAFHLGSGHLGAAPAA